MKSGTLNFLEPSGPLRTCNGTDWPLECTEGRWEILTKLWSYSFWRRSCMKDRRKVKEWYLETVEFDDFDCIHWLARESSGGLSNFQVPWLQFILISMNDTQVPCSFEFSRVCWNIHWIDNNILAKPVSAFLLDYTVMWIQSKNTTINMAKWWCLLARKNYVFRPIVAIFRFWQFSAKRVIYNMPKPTNPLTSHQFSLTTARRMMMRSQHHHVV